jgi:hypothetical protein
MVLTPKEELLKEEKLHETLEDGPPRRAHKEHRSLCRRAHQQIAMKKAPENPGLKRRCVRSGWGALVCEERSPFC